MTQFKMPPGKPGRFKAWFTDVIERIGNHPINRIDDFLPWKWQASKLTNDLEKAA